MAKAEDIRKLKDQAVKAIEKRAYAKAAELYVAIGEREPDVDWHQRAGEAFRKAGDGPRAIAALTLAADGYANGGFLLKAIAVCKSILQVDPTQTGMQARLAELYARRDGEDPRVPAAPPMLHPPAAPAPEAAPTAAPTPLRPEEATPIARVPGAAPPMLRPPIAAASFDQVTAKRADAPMDALPLRHVLGGRRSETVAVSDLMMLADEAEAAAEQPGAYEITLDEEPEIEIVRGPAPIPATIALSDETDFGGINDDPPPAPPPVARPVIPPAPVLRPPPAVAKLPTIDDELDFSSLADDKPRAPAPPPAPLPKIPLFSSLAEADLRFFIEKMTMRNCEAGEVIVHKGDRGGSLFVLVDGEVTVVADGARLATLGAGTFFGEVGVLTDEPRTATVEAAGECTILEVSRELVWELVRRSPEVLRTLLRFLRDRLLERLLGSSALFSGLSPDDARGLASQFSFLELEPGVVAVKQGVRSPGLFLLLSGAAEASRDGKVLGALGPGDVFGEMSLLLRTPASADVRVARKCWALQLPQARFQEIMVTYPQVLEYVSNLGDARKAQNEVKATDTRDDRVDFI